MMKVRQVIRMIEQEDWTVRNIVGSHRQYVHPTKPGRVTISGHLGDDVAKGLLNSIKRQAGLK